MKILLKHILRNIKDNMLRSFLIVFSLSLTTSVLFLNLNIKNDVTESYMNLYQNVYKNYDLEVFYNSPKVDEFSFSPSDVNLNGIEYNDIATFSQWRGAYNASENRKIDVMLQGFDVDKALNCGLVTILEKADNYNSSANDQIIISKKNAAYYGISLGDNIKVETDLGIATFKVGAFAQSNGLLLNEGTEYIQGITTQDAVSYLGGYSGRVYGLLIDLKDSSESEQACNIIKENNEDFECYSFQDVSFIESEFAKINQILLVVLFVVIALCLFVNSSIAKLVIAIRTPTLGVFRSVGATKFRTNILLLSENVIYGILGSVPGIGIGVLLRLIIVKQYVNIDGLKNKLDFNIGFVLISVGFTIVLQLLISLVSVLKTNKKSIKDILFTTISTTAEISLPLTVIGFILIVVSVVLYFINTSFNIILSGAVLLLAITGTVLIVPILTKWSSYVLNPLNKNLFGSEAYIATKNLYTGKTNRSCVVLVSVVMALVLIIYTCVLSISTFFKQYEKNYPYDILVKNTTANSEKYDFIKDIDGVSSVNIEHWDYQKVFLNGTSTSLCFISRNGYSNGVVADEDMLSNLKCGETIVDKMFAVKNNIKIGDTIQIKDGDKDDNDFPLKESDEFSLTVIGFCDTNIFNQTRSSVIITEEEFSKRVETTPAMIGINLENRGDDEMLDMINTIFDEIFKQTNTYARVYSKENYIGMEVSNAISMLSMVSVIPILAVLLSLFGLVNNQLIAFNQKKKEYAVLYSVAMSKVQLKKMIFFEIAETFLIGCIIGSVLGISLSPVVRNIAFIVGIYIDIKTNVPLILAVTAITFAFLCLTAIFPINKIKRINIVEEIKYE